MSKWIDIDDSRNCYIGNDGEYERYNIDPDVMDESINIVPCEYCEHYKKYDKRCTVWNHEVDKNGWCYKGTKRK